MKDVPPPLPMEPIPLFLPRTFLTQEQCAEWLARFDCTEIEGTTINRYWTAYGDGDCKPLPMVVLRTFLFDHARGEAAMIFAVAGSHQGRHEGLDGVMIRYGPGKLHQAAADLVFIATCHTEESIVEDLAEKEAAIVAAAVEFDTGAFLPVSTPTPALNVESENRAGSSPAEANPTVPTTTQQNVAEARHFLLSAQLYCEFADDFRDRADEPGTRETMRFSHGEVCRKLAEALSRPGNREPEMAEALEALERARTEHRELF